MLKCEALLTPAGKTARHGRAIPKKVALAVKKLLLLYASKKYACGRKKPQYYSPRDVFKNTPSVLLQFCLGRLLFPVVEDKRLSL